ncbi:MAG: hypothetical protein Q9219_006226 [cf. Caloplaca sp. 3 TL-2023]
MDLLFCPLCSFSDPGPYVLAQHVETVHPEPYEPPFVSRHLLKKDEAESSNCKEATTFQDAPSHDYMECECGEAVLLSEFDAHVLLHSAESDNLAEHMVSLQGPVEMFPSRGHEVLPSTMSPLRSVDSKIIPTAEKPLESRFRHLETRRSNFQHHSQSILNRQHHAMREWIDLLVSSNASPSHTKGAREHQKSARRLGKAELGPYAHEERMPTWLYKQLERGAKVSLVNQISESGRLVRLEVVANEIRGIMPVLAQLCEQDSLISKVYLCHPGVQHIFKLAKEGGFCGYRNIQMMISFIQATRTQGYEHFPGRVPSILDLQELIESAWDRGINASGKIETGGIRGTRKYIGTPEVSVMETPSAFDDLNGPPAFQKIYQNIERYFDTQAPKSPDKVCQTSLPPIYLQHQGHSLTVVGLEIRKSGNRNLLVFDPSFKPSPMMQRLIGLRFRAAAPEKLLKAYRRGNRYLSKHSNFEVLE